MAAYEDLINKIKGFGPYLFIQYYKDMDTALRVINELPYCTLNLPHIECKPKTEAMVVPAAPPGGYGGMSGPPGYNEKSYAVVTGGDLTPKVAAQVISTCRKYKPLDGSIIALPDGVELGGTTKEETKKWWQFWK